MPTKESENLEKENATIREQLRGLTKRLAQLEAVRENASSAGSVPAPSPSAAPQPNTIQVSSAASAPPRVETPVEAPHHTSLTVTPPPAAATPPKALPPPIAEPARPRTLPIPPASPSARPPNFTGTAFHDAKKSEARSLADLEESLGANWLNKIGTAAFVIGVALLLNYSMHYLGPAGKIALGYALSIILLGIGVAGEKKERYRIAGRAVLGGGWALAYFTTYAMHNIAAVRLVTSTWWGFALLFAVAVGMVAHSLRYRSEITTGFAYLLAFVTVAVSEIPLGALVASALLAASLVVILRARKWFVVEPLAIIATYAVHWMWLEQIYGRIGGRKPFPEFPASIALLSAYWAIYLISYFLRDEKGEMESRLLTASFLLNAAGYLALLHYQSFHPEWRFWFLLSAGAVYFGVSAWARKIGRRWGFVLSSTIGAALMIAAIPYRYSGGRLEILWLVEVEALLVAGWRLVDGHLRRLAWAGATVLAAYVCFYDLAPRLDSWHPPDPKLGWLLVALAAAYYVNGQLKNRLGEDLMSIEAIALLFAPVMATIFMLAAAWVALPFLWTAVAWLAVGVALLEASRPLADEVLWYCGHGAAFFALARLLTVNINSEETWRHVSLRLITVGLCSAILYLESRRHLPREDSATPGTEPVPVQSQTLSVWQGRFSHVDAAYTSAASLLVAFLIWEEVTTAAIALAWGVFGLLLIEAADWLRENPLRIQGQLLLLASFSRIFVADLNSTSQVGVFAAPVITVSLLAAIYYYAAFTTQDSPRIRIALHWFGTISLAALLRFEMPVEWVAVGWAAMAVALYALARLAREEAFLEQCYAMTLFCGVRCAFDNFYQLSPWRFTNVRTATVVACALLIYVLFAAAKLRPSQPKTHPAENPGNPNAFGQSPTAWAWIKSHEQHLFFFIPTILITVLVSLEVRRGFLTAAWGVEGLIVFLAVLKMDERAYRWFSLLLFLLCVARIITVDVWNLDALGRIVSFMGLGIALLLVSFLYARHRELLRRVL